MFAAADADDRLDADGWAAAEIATDAIAARWREPDAGIWELDPAKWTQSRLACAAGLRAAARRHEPVLRRRRGSRSPTRSWPIPRSHALHASGRWQRTPSDPRVDSALLLAGIRGAVGADDPRTQATLRSVLDRAHRGRIRISLPPRRPTACAGGRRVSPVRLPGFAGAARPGRPHRGRPLVRTQSRGVRTSGIVHRGIRRRATTTPRQSSAGLRARVAHRVLARLTEHEQAHDAFQKAKH